MRLLFLGDIVGRTARNTVREQAAALRAELGLDFLIVNCENAAGGFGVTPAICDDLLAAGVDVLTTGNHVWDKGEISPIWTGWIQSFVLLIWTGPFPGAVWCRSQIRQGSGWWSLTLSQPYLWQRMITRFTVLTDYCKI